MSDQHDGMQLSIVGAYVFATLLFAGVMLLADCRFERLEGKTDTTPTPTLLELVATEVAK